MKDAPQHTDPDEKNKPPQIYDYRYAIARAARRDQEALADDTPKLSPAPKVINYGK